MGEGEMMQDGERDLRLAKTRRSSSLEQHPSPDQTPAEDEEGQPSGQEAAKDQRRLSLFTATGSRKSTLMSSPSHAMTVASASSSFGITNTTDVPVLTDHSPYSSIDPSSILHLNLVSYLSSGRLGDTYTTSHPSLIVKLIHPGTTAGLSSGGRATMEDTLGDDEAYTDPDSVRQGIIHEHATYLDLADVQGKYVPRCYGLFGGAQEDLWVLVVERAGGSMGEMYGGSWRGWNRNDR